MAPFMLGMDRAFVIEGAGGGDGDLAGLALAEAPGIEGAVEGGRGVGGGILVGEGDGVADGDGQLGGIELHALDRNGVIGGEGRADEDCCGDGGGGEAEERASLHVNLLDVAAGRLCRARGFDKIEVGAEGADWRTPLMRFLRTWLRQIQEVAFSHRGRGHETGDCSAGR